MKTLITTLAIMMTAISTQTSAQELVFNKVLEDVTYVSMLDNFNVNPNSGLPTRIRAGYVQIRTLSDTPKTIGLTLYPSYYCPPGGYCMMMMPIPADIQVPVINTSSDTCGIKTYIGTKNSNDNGGTVKITVIDGSSNSCPSLVAVPATQVFYETQGLDAEHNTNSSMTGNKLEVQKDSADQ